MSGRHIAYDKYAIEDKCYISNMVMFNDYICVGSLHEITFIHESSVTVIDDIGMGIVNKLFAHGDYLYILGNNHHVRRYNKDLNFDKVIFSTRDRVSDVAMLDNYMYLISSQLITMLDMSDMRTQKTKWYGLMNTIFAFNGYIYITCSGNILCKFDKYIRHIRDIDIPCNIMDVYVYDGIAYIYGDNKIILLDTTDTIISRTKTSTDIYCVRTFHEYIFVSLDNGKMLILDANSYIVSEFEQSETPITSIIAIHTHDGYDVYTETLAGVLHRKIYRPSIKTFDKQSEQVKNEMLTLCLVNRHIQPRIPKDILNAIFGYLFFLLYKVF